MGSFFPSPIDPPPPSPPPKKKSLSQERLFLSLSGRVELGPLIRVDGGSLRLSPAHFCQGGRRPREEEGIVSGGKAWEGRGGVG